MDRNKKEAAAARAAELAGVMNPAPRPVVAPASSLSPPPWGATEEAAHPGSDGEGGDGPGLSEARESPQQAILRRKRDGAAAGPAKLCAAMAETRSKSPVSVLSAHGAEKAFSMLFICEHLSVRGLLMHGIDYQKSSTIHHHSLLLVEFHQYVYLA